MQSKLSLMHQRTLLSILTLPLVVAFTIPMFQRQADKPAKEASVAIAADDPLAGLADIQDVLAHIQANYVDVPDMEKALAGGIQGALERVNLLNSYLTPAETQMPDPGPGETGLTLLKTQLFAIVVGVAPESPAALAGFQVGDRVRKLNGESLGPMSHWALERKMKGSVGSEIDLVRMPSGTTEIKKAVIKRALPKRASITSREESNALMVALPDLAEGRAKELGGLLKAADKKRPLILDLRRCVGGTYEEAAKIASLLGSTGVFATLQETGQPDRPLDAPQSEVINFPKIAILNGLGTVGPAEALAVALRHLGEKGLGGQKAAKMVITLGERTVGLAVERRRFPIKQGGAVELVTRRWMGCGGERLDRTGPPPDYSLRGIPDSEDILPRVLEALEKGPPKQSGESNSVASLLRLPPLQPFLA
jgi:carboxyl-terminal processing protease